MSRDVLIQNNEVTFIERSPTDVTVVPEGVSLFCEEDWRAMVGEPKEGETFEQREKEFITKQNWRLNDHIW